MSARRRTYHSNPMKRLPRRPPNHRLGMRPSKKRCAYCGKKKLRLWLLKLFNGLFICDDHPTAKVRRRRALRGD